MRPQEQVLGPYVVDEGYIVNDGSTTITVSAPATIGPMRFRAVARASVYRPRVHDRIVSRRKTA
jgi:hypothetical protein